MEKQRVLIVDDEPDIVESIKFNLELEDLECLEAYNGQDGVSLAKAERPDLILLDVMLPKVNGYKVARLLKFDDASKNIPIIMLTARTRDSDEQLGQESGADAYVTKPFDMNALVALVKKHLEKETDW